MTREGIVFTIVVPTVGRVRRLDGCLAALADLDYPGDAYEVVVVNDGGGTEIERIVNRWEDQLRITVLSTCSVGPSAARNAGAAVAHGHFLGFTDDDCEPDSHWLTVL